MPHIQTLVTEYKVSAKANRSAYMVQVNCYRHGQEVGTLHFEQNRTVGEASISGGSPRAVLRYPLEMFGPVMDILRNEKPILLTLNSSHTSGTIGTMGEEVGEQEL